MITVEMLNDVKHVIVHDRCPDGMASAIILLDAFRGRLTAQDVTFLEHETECYEKHAADPGTLFCDITPPPRRAQEFVDAGVLVLDHHEPEKVTPYGARGVHGSEPGVSGAVLAFREVWVPLQVPFRETVPSDHVQYREFAMETFATLAGIRDTWQKDDPRFRQASAQAAALMFWPRAAWLEDVISKGAHRANSERLDLGETLLEKVEEDARRFIAEQESFISSRGRVVNIVATKMTSEPAEMLTRAFALTPRPAHAPDVLIGFRYFVDHGVRMIELSCRSVSDVPVRPFCQRFGGGGHLRAAGVSLSVSVRDGNPYEMIRALWNRWEETT